MESTITLEYGGQAAYMETNLSKLVVYGWHVFMLGEYKMNTNAHKRLTCFNILENCSSHNIIQLTLCTRWDQE